MLELAYFNSQTLKPLYTMYILKPENKYYYADYYLNYDLTIESNEQRKLQYVSKDKSNKIVAYFAATVNRNHRMVENIEIIRLTDSFNRTATTDFFYFLNVLFAEKGFRKIIFRVIVENPSLKLFQKFINKTQIGKYVGTLQANCFLHDGRYYDQAVFEIYCDSYIEWINKQNYLYCTLGQYQEEASNASV